MDKSKNFTTSLPENYVLVKHVDAKKDTKLIAIYTVLSFVPFVVIFPILCVVAYFCNGYNLFDLSDIKPRLIAVWVMLGVFVVYIILHELTHGITYKAYTGQKLTFGMTLTVAFCGVPDIYVRKKASLSSLVMPFAVFSVVFIGLTIGLWFISPLYGVLSGIVFAIHLGGCVGDLHWTLLYLTKFKHCNTLMRDTGPQQWLYIPKEEAQQYNIPAIETTQSST